MPAVEDNESHAGKDAVVDAIDDPVRDLVVREVSPPNQHIRLCQSFFRQTVFMFIKGRSFNRQARNRLQV